jgi:RNA polymerase sigma-70 factor (ECF subfamily)
MHKPRPAEVPREAASSSTAPASRQARLDLARRAAEGDARSTRSLLELVAPTVSRTIRTMMGSRHPEVDDAAQLALIGFVQALPTFRGECDPAHFAARIAIRTAGAARRRFRSRRVRHDDSIDIDDLEAPPDSPEAALRRRAVLELVDRLPEEQAETMALRFVLGWKLHEIAAATGAPFNTVRSRLRLAKEALLKRIEGDPALAEALDTPDEE